ncbi:hypothetical protein D3C86_2008730 [compost metagenome]
MGNVSVFEKSEFKIDNSVNEYVKVLPKKRNILAIVGFTGFGIMIFTALILMLQGPLIETLTSSTEIVALPGLTNYFALVFAAFWLICLALLLLYLYCKLVVKIVKGF